MRRLLRISVEGFKTFAGRTDLELGPGMTAVVGPNGSGKSNLIDALAWAVGSRSWKTLRGDGMEDVIFHGADGRPAAPLARVSLSFENEDRLLPIDFSEVTITREISRGGGSRSLLNGVEARVKDLQSLLSGTGLVGGFSLIRQGIVDRLILSAPDEVGRWVEESASIAGYRVRKQEAVDRLQKVESHAAEAERRSAALRRELVRVRERAARVRARRELEERRTWLGSILRSLEGRRLREALEAVAAESVHLRAELSLLAAQRKELSSLRCRLEEELQGSEVVDPAEAPEASAIAERVIRIREAGGLLRSIAERLAREGAGGWPDAAERLDRAAAAIRSIRSPRAPQDRSSGASACLSELRRCTTELERLEREGTEHAAALSSRDCERARLEERIAALGEGQEPAAPLPPDLDAELARRELEELGRDAARLGPVDETAEHREREVLQELAVLAPVLQDLAATRSQLSTFLRQMEQHTSSLFAHTLSKVEARFRSYCGILFQGGDARLERVDSPGEEEGDPLRAAPPGIEVRVKLPRKPETSLSLLSGGERSLAGLALILALAAGERGEGQGSGRLLILDEVDAALDEANAARLALLLRELQQEHQLLCVTHNRLTMHQASRLVGVTSGAASGSALVKVDLERSGSAA